jgi:hypothetical protein
MPSDLDGPSHALSVSHPATTFEGSAGLYHVPDVLRGEAEAAAGFATEQHARATRTAYESDFAIFRAWCTARELATLPALPAAVAAFLAAQAEHASCPSQLALGVCLRIGVNRYRRRKGRYPIDAGPVNDWPVCLPSSSARPGR